MIATTARIRFIGNFFSSADFPVASIGHRASHGHAAGSRLFLTSKVLYLAGRPGVGLTVIVRQVPGHACLAL